MLIAIAALCILASAHSADRTKLTATERAQGWRLLFDGESISDWRGYRSGKVPRNWQVRDGVLSGFAGDALVTAEAFDDFELVFDWRVAEGGHGEIYFHVSEDAAHPEETGPVMELAGHGNALATNSGLTAPDRKVMPQFGVWHRSRIVVFGDVVEYWLGGDRVLGFTIGASDWQSAVSGSRFAAFPEFARFRRGVIALSGEGVEFRNIRIKSRSSL